MVLAVAMLSVSALANEERGCNDKDILEMGIFETEQTMLKFPAGQDTNIDSLEVGNDKAFAYGSIWQKTPRAVATNNLEIKKTQESGPCECCTKTYSEDADMAAGGKPKFEEDCQDCCIKINVDQIKVGNRDAQAFGFASATNNVKILATQE
jgi:hypothetical protein